MNQIKQKTVYFSALFPAISIVLYLGTMVLGLADGFNFIALLIFLAATVGWGATGAWFARTRNTFIKSSLIANALPILCTIVYTILYLIARINEMEPEINLTGEEIITLLDVAEIIGGLGTGLFGLLSTWLYNFVDLGYFEVLANLLFSLVVFAVGFAIGSSTKSKQKNKSIKTVKSRS